MRKFNFSTGVSTALVAMALVTGLSVPVDAAKVDKALSQSEVTKSGVTFATAAPTVSVENVADGQVATSWKVKISDVPAPVKDANGNIKESFKTRVLIFDKGDRTKPLNGSSTVNKNGTIVYSDGRVFYYDDDLYDSAERYQTTFNGSSYTPGQKEIVAFLFDAAAYQAAEDAYYASTDPNKVHPDSDEYWIASAPAEITVSDEASVYTSVTSTSIELSLNSGSINTGYEIYRKVGKKYQQIATVTSDVYTDKGLVSKTTYSYKVRPYYKDVKTGAVTYGKEGYVEATTKGSALNVVANVNKKNKVVLTWQKVKGAKKYEIYRRDTSSYSSEVKKGEYNGYATYKKIATVKKKKYIDKKVQKNRNYVYEVRAVIAKDKKVKGDKDAYVKESVDASLNFGQIDVNVSYRDANGNATVEWEKVYGAISYIVEKKAYDPATKMYNWTTVQTLPASATKTTLAAEVVADTDGSVVSTTTKYRIKAVSAAGNSSAYTVDVTKKNGNVESVTATATANGIQVSWTPVAGAAYYKVYRVKTSALLNNKDIGAYAVQHGSQVTEYVGVTTPVAVDVAAWNATVDASIAQEKKDLEAWDWSKGSFDSSKYLHESDKLNAKATYHYQNYAYAHDTFTATSMVDYFGDIYSAGSGSMDAKKGTLGADGKAAVTEWNYRFNPVVADSQVKSSPEDGRPQVGVNYTYYVEAVMASPKAAGDYYTGDTCAVPDVEAYNKAVEEYKTQLAEYQAKVKEKEEADKKYEEDLKKYEEDLKKYEALTEAEKENAQKPEKPVKKYVDVPYVPQSEPKQENYTKWVSINDASAATAATTQLVYNTAATGPKASNAEYLGQAVAKNGEDNFKNVTGSTAGVKKVGSAAVTAVQPIKGKVKIKSASSSKGKVTLKVKKVAGADCIKIYRSTKKKGKYTVAGIAKNGKKFTDKGVKKGKKYYYKAVPVVKNEAGADVEGKASKVKAVKVK